MNVSEAITRAIEEPTLLDALSWIAVWESERVVRQAHAFLDTGERTMGDEKGWDTMFSYLFKQVDDAWRDKEMARDMKQEGSFRLVWRPHEGEVRVLEKLAQGQRIRVWRDDWAHDSFEVLSSAETFSLLATCMRFGIPLVRAGD